VASCFNTQWAEHFCHPTRTAKGLKTKFRELVHGPLTGGGKRSLLEQRALHCEKLIDKKHGVITQSSEISDDHSSDNSESPRKPRNKVRTRMAFEKEISSHMIKNFELAEKSFEEMKRLELEAQQAAQQRHNDRMELLREIFLKK
jgi:hypothetical protein